MAAFPSPDAAAAARGPGPEHAAALADELERILSDLDPLERRILELRLQGERIADVAGDVGRSERTVRRILKGLEALFVSRLATD